MANGVSGSGAYDLSLFEPKKAEIIPLKPDPRQEKQLKKRSRFQSFLNVVVTCAVGLAVVGVIALLICNRVQLTEMNNQIAKKQEQLNELISETDRLEGELAARTSAQSVEEYALQQGMQKMDQSQVVYITVDGGDHIEGEQQEDDGFWTSLYQAIVRLFE